MEPDARFVGLEKAFWANVRTISQKFGYTARGQGLVKYPSLAEVQDSLEALGLTSHHIAQGTSLTDFGATLLDYFEYRADILNYRVEGMLMDAEEAEVLFNSLYHSLDPTCPLPMNKQKGQKRTYAFMTGMVNMLLEDALGENACNFDPYELTTVTRDGIPVRTLARRVDGAFPSPVNPIAIWEIKEYYYTTTFGSRVSDGVYETLLDGMEIEELRENEGIDVKHYFIVDSYYTWWTSGGRSYLCRMIDMLHMGYVDEVIFGKEVVERLPYLASQWLETLDSL